MSLICPIWSVIVVCELDPQIFQGNTSALKFPQNREFEDTA